MLSESSLNPEAWIFMLQEYTNIFLFGKNVLIVMVTILINKDVFEPSYNDLKFTDQSYNYFCTNLINTMPLPSNKNEQLTNSENFTVKHSKSNRRSLKNYPKINSISVTQLLMCTHHFCLALLTITLRSTVPPINILSPNYSIF